VTGLATGRRVRRAAPADRRSPRCGGAPSPRRHAPTWPPWSTCPAAAWSAGPWRITCAPSSSRTPWRWLLPSAAQPRAWSSTPIMPRLALSRRTWEWPGQGRLLMDSPA